MTPTLTPPSASVTPSPTITPTLAPPSPTVAKIDVDWEFPVSGGLAGNGHRPEDKQNFTALLVEFRRQMDALGKADSRTYRLSIAASAGPTEIANIEAGAIAQVVDWIDVMAYAFYTGKSKITNFNAPLYLTSTDPATDEKKRRLYNCVPV